MSVWSLECATTVRVLAKSFRSPPSTLYTCQPRCGWIGSALPRARKPRGFAEFGGIQRAVSMPAAQFSSPLRLPISPSGRCPSVAVRMGRRRELQRSFQVDVQIGRNDSIIVSSASRTALPSVSGLAARTVCSSRMAARMTSPALNIAAAPAIPCAIRRMVA